jgi:hypothetical protein
MPIRRNPAFPVGIVPGGFPKNEAIKLKPGVNFGSAASSIPESFQLTAHLASTI